MSNEKCSWCNDDPNDRFHGLCACTEEKAKKMPNPPCLHGHHCLGGGINCGPDWSRLGRARKKQNMGDYKEPWKHLRDGKAPDDPYLGIADSENSLITCWEEEPSDKAMEIERRIIACVNACVGIPTTQLEGKSFVSCCPHYHPNGVLRHVDYGLEKEQS